MAANQKFETMLSHLRTNEQARTVGLQRAERMLADFKLDHVSDELEAFKKIGAVVDSSKSKFNLVTEPFAFTLLERANVTDKAITGTGSVRCTFSDWDGCGGDVDF
jgi:hypothetical protein